MTYKFIDLFAGIGGFRLGFEKVGFQCVFSSEIDAHAREIYFDNFGELPFGDIREISIKTIPNFDILLAGFPCQPFSIAGEKKGFNDIRGTLFFDIAKILEYHQPKVVVLENVKHFKNHDHGKTLNTILITLNKLGYTTNWALLNAIDFGVPQNRERTIIIGYLGDIEFDFNKLKKVNHKKLKDVLEDNSEEFEYLKENEYTLIENPKQQMSGLIFAGYRNKNIRVNGTRPDTQHLSRVHKQPNRIYSSQGSHPTLSSQESAGRYYLLHNGKVRKLTLKECYRLMGFSDDFKLIGSKGKLYNRVGNSIVIPMVEEIAKQVKEQLFNKDYALQYSLKPKQMSLLDLALLCSY
ncbi:DNA-cytosine methyltransferase [Geminocystis sp. NIES-3708]|uniref:DNA cytosine methyltransferase n=1 Tax=Geminocystis sp. NIES-3708 TaxID=1615909 RepID=UPI0005FCD89A|nr:DNA (cytosine-5-)-methyltransferase [Geminocystis sp. NIES-3708]BAQ62915.1 DNA-cytosine methyltransferase [Geminocystis sp. NIES-3708]